MHRPHSLTSLALAALALSSVPALAEPLVVGRLAFPEQEAYGIAAVVTRLGVQAPPVPLSAFAADVAAHGFPEYPGGAVTVVMMRRPGAPLTPAMEAVERGPGLPSTVVVNVDDDPDHQPMVALGGEVSAVKDLRMSRDPSTQSFDDGFALEDPGVRLDDANARAWTGHGDVTSVTALGDPARYPTPTGTPIVLVCSTPHAPANSSCVTTHLLADGVTAMTDGPLRATPPGDAPDAVRAAATDVRPDDKVRSAQSALALLPLLVQAR